MIIDSYRCIFIHIPRTGGYSIETALTGRQLLWPTAHYDILWGFDKERQAAMQHSTLSEMIKYYQVPQEKIDKYFKFTFVRNPWDRMVSEYLWLLKQEHVPAVMGKKISVLRNFFRYGENILIKTKCIYGRRQSLFLREKDRPLILSAGSKTLRRILQRYVLL